MALSAVQNSSSSDLRRQSFIKSAASGAVVAYALKWAIPITPQEKEDVFLSEAKQLDADAKIVEEEVEAIRMEKLNSKNVDKFVQLYNEKKIDFSDSIKPEPTLSKGLKKLYSRVRSRVREAKEVGIKNRTVLTKGIRPTSAFLISGISVGLLSALIHNVYVENAKNNVSNEALSNF